MDWYNFSAPEGCCVDLPDKGEVRMPNAMGATVMMVGDVAQPAHAQQDLWETSVPVIDIGITVTVGDILMAGNGAPITAESTDPQNEFEIVHGMPVYYGGYLNDSDCETPREGCCVDLPDKGEVRMPNAMGATVMMVGDVAQPAHAQQDLWETSVPVIDIGITVTVGDILMAGNGAPITAESTDPQNEFEIVHGMPVYYGGYLNDSDCETPRDNDYDTWEDWCDSDIRDRYCGFPSDNEETQFPVIICAPVFRGKDMDELLRVRPDYWDVSVSVMHVTSDPVVALLSPDTVWGDEIALHKVEEDCQSNAVSMLP